MIRTLRADEIEVRVGTCSEKGTSLLLYKDARCDMNILDEEFGTFNWKREHSRDNRNCIVSVWDSEKSQWVSKEDTGTESNTEAEKGLASDSFKRACVNWGIGRELYTAPFLWISTEKLPVVQKGTRYVPKSSNFKVVKIKYNDSREITNIAISCDGKVIYAK